MPVALIRGPLTFGLIFFFFYQEQSENLIIDDHTRIIPRKVFAKIENISAGKNMKIGHKNNSGNQNIRIFPLKNYRKIFYLKIIFENQCKSSIFASVYLLTLIRQLTLFAFFLLDVTS